MGLNLLTGFKKSEAPPSSALSSSFIPLTSFPNSRTIYNFFSLFFSPSVTLPVLPPPSLHLGANSECAARSFSTFYSVQCVNLSSPSVITLSSRAAAAAAAAAVFFFHIFVFTSLISCFSFFLPPFFFYSLLFAFHLLFFFLSVLSPFCFSCMLSFSHPREHKHYIHFFIQSTCSIGLYIETLTLSVLRCQIPFI